MLYSQKEPVSDLSAIIKRFWMADSQGDSSIRQQKIIPDGYPELIFHYADPYQIKIHDQWQLQSKSLLAGQIRNYFYLKNTGPAAIFAITLQPWTVKNLFGMNMATLVDRVITIDNAMMQIVLPVQQIAVSLLSFDEKVFAIEKWFLQYASKDNTNSKGQQAAQYLLDQNGKVTIRDILSEYDINEKTLERYFKLHIGLSPKFYSRIIRLSYVFRLITNNKADWTELAFLAGFYDQSHFIKNFKEFTGDEPSRYGFSEKNMANFFLQP